MRVKALSNINSGQYNTGDEFDISDSEALELIEAGAVESLDEVKATTEDTAPVEAPANETPLKEETISQPTPQESLPQSPTLKNEGKQPTAEEIAQTVAATEKSSEDLPSVHIS